MTTLSYYDEQDGQIFQLAEESSLRRMSLTDWGLAWPRVARMTWPTKNLKTPSLPDLYLATLSGFLAMMSRAASSMAESATWAPRPSAATMSAAERADSNIAAKTFLPTAAVILPDSTKETNSARDFALTGLASISLSESLRRRRSSVCIQLAAALPGPPAFTTDSK